MLTVAGVGGIVPVNIAEISDGTSNTLAIGEYATDDAGDGAINRAMWAGSWGYMSLSHTAPNAGVRRAVAQVHDAEPDHDEDDHQGVDHPAEEQPLALALVDRHHAKSRQAQASSAPLTCRRASRLDCRNSIVPRTNR